MYIRKQGTALLHAPTRSRIRSREVKTNQHSEKRFWHHKQQFNLTQHKTGPSALSNQIFNKTHRCKQGRRLILIISKAEISKHPTIILQLFDISQIECAFYYAIFKNYLITLLAQQKWRRKESFRETKSEGKTPKTPTAGRLTQTKLRAKNSMQVYHMRGKNSLT